MQMRIMTFNVRGSFHDDGANSWENRRELSIATIKKYTPDIIGFQEAQSGNLQTFDSELATYANERGPISIRKTERYHHVPIYWQRDSFIKVGGGGFYLSETPDEWSIGWNASYARAATWVRLQHNTTGIGFFVLNTHFNHEPDNHHSRTESAKLIVNRLQSIAPLTEPVVVMADFNARPGSEAHKVFIANGFQDTYYQARHMQDVNTFHGFNLAKFSYEDLRIDWILIKDGRQKFTTKRCDVISDNAKPLYPSDHYPVLAEVELA